MGLKDIPPSDSNAILCRYKPYFATKSNIVYSGLPSEHESSNFCQSPAPRRSTILKFSLPRFLAIHLARQSPFYGPAGHIRSRDGLQEDHRPATDRQHTAVRARLVTGYCPGPLSSNSSDKAIAILRASKAHPLARWFAGRRPNCHTRPYRASVPLSCNSSDKAIAILRASRAH